MYRRPQRFNRSKPSAPPADAHEAPPQPPRPSAYGSFPRIAAVQTLPTNMKAPATGGARKCAEIAPADPLLKNDSGKGRERDNFLHDLQLPAGETAPSIKG